jgi:arylsulfatase A-like enzyme
MAKNGWPPQTTTIPEALKKEGYSTAHFGKWHLGGLLLSSKVMNNKPQW